MQAKRLWFAFSYYLCDESQHVLKQKWHEDGCDLLSVIIFVMNHSSSFLTVPHYPVVICFQLLSLWWITATFNFHRRYGRLWFAFSYYLCDESQQQKMCILTAEGCDLLSVIIFVMNHSRSSGAVISETVVICFQLLSLWWITALVRVQLCWMLLWFAFSYYLCDESQLCSIHRM